tara:strand:+ start:898 stop:1065 length:168 start_codon:yes stop_codon:yes gene_type:complete
MVPGQRAVGAARTVVGADGKGAALRGLAEHRLGRHAHQVGADQPERLELRNEARG